MATKFERMGEKNKRFIDTQKKKIMPSPTKKGPQAGRTMRKNVKRG